MNDAPATTRFGFSPDNLTPEEMRSAHVVPSHQYFEVAVTGDKSDDNKKPARKKRIATCRRPEYARLMVEALHALADIKGAQ